MFHAEGFAEIELHYTAQLTIQPVRGFVNGSHHFPAAESPLNMVARLRFLAINTNNLIAIVELMVNSYLKQ